MKILITISSAVIAATLAAQSAQDSTPAPHARRGLTKVAPQGSSNARVQSPQLDAAQSLDAWREQLTDSDLAARERAFERLVAAARRNADLAQAVRDWSTDTAAGSVDNQVRELAWTARLALRELQTQPFDMFGWPGLDLRGLGIQGVDPQGQPFPGFDPALPFDPRDLQRQFGQGWPDMDFGGPSGGLAAPGDSNSSCESFSLSIGPEGAKCTVTRNIDGQEVSEEYEAESLDKLLEAHPELSDKLRGGFDPFDNSMFGAPGQGGGLLRVNPFEAFGRDSAGGGARPTPDQGGAVDLAPLSTDILGVVVQPLSEAESKRLDLAAGVGLRIERVENGTIARSMGLQRGQVLIELNGRALATRDDITEQLEQRGADAQIECVVIDRWGQRRTHTWKPDPGRQL